MTLWRHWGILFLHNPQLHAGQNVHWRQHREERASTSLTAEKVEDIVLADRKLAITSQGPHMAAISESLWTNCAWIKSLHVRYRKSWPTSKKKPVEGGLGKVLSANPDSSFWPCKETTYTWLEKEPHHQRRWILSLQGLRESLWNPLSILYYSEKNYGLLLRRPNKKIARGYQEERHGELRAGLLFVMVAVTVFLESQDPFLRRSWV